MSKKDVVWKWHASPGGWVEVDYQRAERLARAGERISPNIRVTPKNRGRLIAGFSRPEGWVEWVGASTV